MNLHSGQPKTIMRRKRAEGTKLVGRPAGNSGLEVIDQLITIGLL